MGFRGPIPQRSTQRRRRNKPLGLPVEVVIVHVCRRDDCRAVVGNVYHDPDGRWCAAGHDQRIPDDVGGGSDLGAADE